MTTGATQAGDMDSEGTEETVSGHRPPSGRHTRVILPRHSVLTTSMFTSRTITVQHSMNGSGMPVISSIITGLTSMASTSLAGSGRSQVPTVRRIRLRHI